MLLDTLGDSKPKQGDTACETVAKVQAEVLINKVAARVAVVNLKTPADKPTKVEAEALDDKNGSTG